MNNRYLRKLFNFVEKKTKIKYYGLLTRISPEFSTKIRYKNNFKRKMDLKNPQTFNEKIAWLKLYYCVDNPLVIQCADKYSVREYIKSCGCEEILNTLIFAWDKPSEIDWDILPESFVIKWNYGCGANYICPDKTKSSKKEVVRFLKNFSQKKICVDTAELHYRKIRPKIICEEYLNDGSGKRPIDYKVYCFNGEPKYVMACIGRGKGKTKYYWFDKEWNFVRLNWDGINAPSDFSLKKPECLDELFKYAALISKPFPFVRADFYCVKNKVIFGELTFTPCAGQDKDYPLESSLALGALIELPKQN